VVSASSEPDATVAYGRRVLVTGAVSPASVGRTVRLQYAPAGAPWRVVAEATTDALGRFSLPIAPRHSGALRVVAAPSVPGGVAAVSPATRIRVLANLSGDGRDHRIRGRRHLIRGILRPARSHRLVRLQKYYWGRGWFTVGRARTGRGGRFVLAWRPRRIGTFRLRLGFAGDLRNGGTRRRVPGGLNVYRTAIASWYGPGFYGRSTPCKVRLRVGTLGVAHRRLRCGTRVRFYHRGRSVRVRVIDRGPYVPGREWDLTYATKLRLGFRGLGPIASTR
jgi:hypothetical protein